jgi:hypothetical protein
MPSLPGISANSGRMRNALALAHGTGQVLVQQGYPSGTTTSRRSQRHWRKMGTRLLMRPQPNGATLAGLVEGSDDRQRERRR